MPPVRAELALRESISDLVNTEGIAGHQQKTCEYYCVAQFLLCKARLSRRQKNDPTMRASVIARKPTHIIVTTAATKTAAILSFDHRFGAGSCGKDIRFLAYYWLRRRVTAS
jgi:hypothetical protein